MTVNAEEQVKRNRNRQAVADAYAAEHARQRHAAAELLAEHLTTLPLGPERLALDLALRTLRYS